MKPMHASHTGKSKRHINKNVLPQYRRQNVRRVNGEFHREVDVDGEKEDGQAPGDAAKNNVRCRSFFE